MVKNFSNNIRRDKKYKISLFEEAIGSVAILSIGSVVLLLLAIVLK